jgi:hypothetical protein
MAAFRLPTQALADLDRLVEALQRRSAGRVSKADAIAWAVARVLGELDEQDRKAKMEAERAELLARMPWPPARDRAPRKEEYVTVYITSPEDEE